MTRFGCENPCPSITKRLAWYGNSEDVEKMIERIAKGTSAVDKDQFGGNEFEQGNKYRIMNADSATQLHDTKKQRDLEETEMLKPKGAKKRSGVTDIKLLLDNAGTGKRFSNPAEAILTKGISIKIKDIDKNDRSRAKDK